MLRVLTVTLNPALDQVYEVPNFTVGKLNRALVKTTTAGGKGINVARAYTALGGKVAAIGIVGGGVGAIIESLVQEEGIPAAFVRIAPESRICIKVTDPVSGTQTELNEPGPAVSDADFAVFVEQFRELLPTYDVVVLSGSVPPGIPTDVYARLIRLARDEYQIRTVLDASGEWLTLGIAASPWFVKPNRDEAAGLGVACEPWYEAPSMLRRRFGVDVALVSGGADGAAIDSAGERWIARPPAIDVKSAVGSGDSLTAGVLAFWQSGRAGDALKFGVAVGAVNAQSYRSGDVSVDRAAAMADRVVLTRLP